jgi:hypothetical protein
MRLAFASLVLILLFLSELLALAVVNALASLRTVRDSALATGTRPPAAR